MGEASKRKKLAAEAGKPWPPKTWTPGEQAFRTWRSGREGVETKLARARGEKPVTPSLPAPNPSCKPLTPEEVAATCAPLEEGDRR